MNNNLGKIICNLRKEKNITQKDLADALNVSDKAISRWECGTSRPDLEMMFLISKYFGISYNKLITARISDNHKDDKIVEEIIKEFSDMGNKKAKRIKIILLISIVLIVFLIIGFVFSNSYNRFKVYKVYGESDNIYKLYGTYIETKTRDVLYFGDIKIKNVEVKDTDIISVDLYIIENNEKKIIQNYSELNEIYLILSENFIDIDNFSDYFDNAYLRVSITDEKGKTKEYETKLEFVLDFSNNKIYYNDNFLIEEYNCELTDYSKINVSETLLNNGYEKSIDNVIYKNTEDYKINYRIDTNLISYSYDKNGFRYRYKYRLNSNYLIVTIYDDKQTIIEDYEFDVENNKMNCKVGSCSDYEEVMKILEEKVLYLLK